MWAGVRRARWGRKTHLDDGLGLDEVRAAADDDSGLAVRRYLVHGGPEELEVLEAARAVGVDHEKAAAAGVEHAVADGAALADVLLEDDDADVAGGVLCAELEGEVGGAVAGAVVDDEDLVGAGGPRGLEVGERGLEHGREALRLVVGGDDDSEVDGGRVADGRKGEGRGGLACAAVGLFGGLSYDGFW